MPRPALIVPAGKRYGNLVTTGVYIPSYMDLNKRVPASVECRCDCGRTSFKQLSNLKRPGKISCGSSCSYYTNNNATTHGLSKDEMGKESKEYRAWQNMISCCLNPESRGFQYIGKKGITYHESLSTIEGFMEVMGRSPSKYHRLTRIDKEGNFEPGNVHWYCPATRRKK